MIWPKCAWFDNLWLCLKKVPSCNLCHLYKTNLQTKMTRSCELATITPQVWFELFMTTILASRKQWRSKLKNEFKCIHTWIVGAKNFGGHNGASMQALWTKRMAMARQIFSNEARKVMSWKTLMLRCCFNFETKWKAYKWEQWGFEKCTKLNLTSNKMLLWFHPHPI